jgi:Outer membrane protein beta-barrel domain
MRHQLLCLVVLLSPLAATARDEPRLEAFGGYSWMTTSLLQDTGFLEARKGLSGWNSSLSWNTTHNLGFVAEFSGFAGTPSQNGTSVTTRYYSFLAGPKITHHSRNDKLEVFVHQLFGTSHASLTSGPASHTSSGFGLAAGMGIDYVIRKHFSLRPFELDYTISQLAPHSQNQFRVSAGVLVRWSFVERSMCPKCSSDSPAAGNSKKSE